MCESQSAQDSAKPPRWFSCRLATRAILNICERFPLQRPRNSQRSKVFFSYTLYSELRICLSQISRKISVCRQVVMGSWTSTLGPGSSFSWSMSNSTPLKHCSRKEHLRVARILVNRFKGTSSRCLESSGLKSSSVKIKHWNPFPDWCIHRQTLKVG